MHKQYNCNLRKMHAKDLEMVFAWRNHPSIRQHMITQHLITMDEHRQWFEQTSSNPHCTILLVEHQDAPFGLVHFTDIQADASVEWGFYVAPDARKGSGHLLGKCALAFAFEQLSVHKVCGRVLANNEVSIRFHERLGFSFEGRLREQVLIPPNHQDLLCFGLLQCEWLQISPHKG